MKMNNNELSTKNNYRIFYDPFFDAFLDFSFPKGKPVQKCMHTDITENDKSYLLAVDLPGFKKEDVKIDLENGYLSIEATRQTEPSEDSKFIRRERFYQSCKRSFFVGDLVKPEDISANLEDGVLKITVLKRVEEQPTAKRIQIL